MGEWAWGELILPPGDPSRYRTLPKGTRLWPVGRPNPPCHTLISSSIYVPELYTSSSSTKTRHHRKSRASIHRGGTGHGRFQTSGAGSEPAPQRPRAACLERPVLSWRSSSVMTNSLFDSQVGSLWRSCKHLTELRHNVLPCVPALPGLLAVPMLMEKKRVLLFPLCACTIC